MAEFNQFKDYYKKQGAPITNNMSDEQVLTCVEEWEDRPAEEAEPTAEERIAAALEFQNLNSLEG